MLRGIYTATTAMLGESRRQEVTVNNMANVDTVGFKRQFAISKPLAEAPVTIQGDGPGAVGSPLPLGDLGFGAAMSAAVTSFTQGSLRPTGNSLDVALQGKGFFSIDVRGETMYTRDGAFRIDKDGYLVTGDGNRVLGENGPIQIGSGEVVIGQDGTVMVDNKSAGRLKVVDFDDNSVLQRLGDNLFTTTAASKPAAAEVRQGFLEGANVQPVREMVELISIMRSYEANQRLVKAQDEILGKAVNDIGRV